MAKKKNNKWVVLCSTAITAVYAAGYIVTENPQTVPRFVQNVHSDSLPTYGSVVPTESAEPKESEVPAESVTPAESAQPPESEKPAENTPPKIGKPSKQSEQPAPSAQPAPSEKPSPSAKPAEIPAPASRYKDGTYTGMGMNRRGSIEVTVTIKKDKITDVEISDFGMHYPESDVDGLPAEVLQIQSPDVQNVSGATYSTRAFEDAVQEALSQALNA